MSRNLSGFLTCIAIAFNFCGCGPSQTKASLNNSPAEASARSVSRLYAAFNASLRDGSFAALQRASTTALLANLVANTTDAPHTIGTYSWSGTHSKLIAQTEELDQLAALFPTVGDLLAWHQFEPSVVTLDVMTTAVQALANATGGLERGLELGQIYGTQSNPLFYGAGPESDDDSASDVSDVSDDCGLDFHYLRGQITGGVPQIVANRAPPTQLRPWQPGQPGLYPGAKLTGRPPLYPKQPVWQGINSLISGSCSQLFRDKSVETSF